MRVPLSRDGWLILLTCSLRSLAYGFLPVILGLYLDALGLLTTAIGWIFTAVLAGGLKIVYELWIFAVFRKVRPPEEERRRVS